jgi:hypothetical protein
MSWLLLVGFSTKVEEDDDEEVVVVVVVELT